MAKTLSERQILNTKILDYYEGTLTGAFRECTIIEIALGVERIAMRTRLEQWSGLIKICRAAQATKEV